MFVFISLMSVAESLLPQRKGAGDVSLWREVWGGEVIWGAGGWGVLEEGEATSGPRSHLPTPGASQTF